MIKLLKTLRDRTAKLEQENIRLKAQVKNLETLSAHHANMIEMLSARLDVTSERISNVAKFVTT